MRITISGLVIIVACATFTGCSSGGGTEGGFTSRDEINDSFRGSISELQFPPGTTPPTAVPGIDADPAGTSYQKTYGDTRAHYVWQCAWEKEWLDTRATDPSAAAAALEQLGKAPAMPYLADPQRTDDATRRMFRENLDKAALGDPSAMQEDVDVNCS